MPFPNAGSLAADRNPYADPAAPYKVDRVQASGKFPEPILNTPKTITVLSKEVLADKNITSLREVGRSTAGVTLGSGEGGNAFGDRFFIRGFDARNDVLSTASAIPRSAIRENFFTEQIEILRGPASSYAGRGTAGGAINIVTKQAADRNFYNTESTFGTDHTKRVTLDVNQVISPTFSVRTGGMFQDANVAGRNYVTDDRWGGFISTKWTPTNDIKITTNYIHTDFSGLPDFGVPVSGRATRPSPRCRHPAPELVRLRQSRLPDRAAGFRHAHGRVQGHRQHHADQPDPRGALAAGLYRHAAQRADHDRCQPRALDVHRQPAEPQPVGRYPGEPGRGDVQVQHRIGQAYVGGRARSLQRAHRDRPLHGPFVGSVWAGAPGSGALANQSIYAPSYTFLPFPTLPSLIGNPTRYNVDSKALYVMDTANWQDTIILNGGVRYDGYDLRSSNNTASAKVNSDFINYNVGAVFKPVPIGSLYAAYATSTNPFGSELDGTGTDYGGAPPNGATILGPERNKAAEIGTKWELFDRHLLVTGALFHTEKDNARETVGGVLTSGAAYQVEGIDLEVSGKITDRWSVFGGLVLMRSKVTQSGIASNIGLQMANIAHESFSMLSKYKFDGGWELGGQAVYRSKIYGGTFGANTGTELPSYWRFDAFVEKKIDKNWTMKLYAQNLTNKLYYDTLYRSATPFVAVAPGRAFYLVTSAKF